MTYQLGIDGTDRTIPGGTSLLLVHPSTAATDRLDTAFLKDSDTFLVVSTRTTAREVIQKLDHYGIDESKAEILDTLSVERGYSRRATDHIHYVSAPDDIGGIIQQVREFLESTSGKRRVSFDSISEISYYADEEQAAKILEEVGGLLKENDAVGIFHVDREVHDLETLERYKSLVDGVIELSEEGETTMDV
ncbi:MAG: ATPase domain-containing protein [Halobacteriaceae archaeon]